MKVKNPVGVPVNKHLGRLDGVGHMTGWRELNVNHSGREADFERANLVVLQHLQIIDPWVIEHKMMIKNEGLQRGWHMLEAEIIREHNSTFVHWFGERFRTNPPPGTIDDAKLIYALAHGPVCNLTTYQPYDINGYTFYTEVKDKNSELQNSGVTIKSSTGNDG